MRILGFALAIVCIGVALAAVRQSIQFDPRAAELQELQDEMSATLLNSLTEEQRAERLRNVQRQAVAVDARQNSRRRGSGHFTKWAQYEAEAERILALPPDARQVAIDRRIDQFQRWSRAGRGADQERNRGRTATDRGRNRVAFAGRGRWPASDSPAWGQFAGRFARNQGPAASTGSDGESDLAELRRQVNARREERGLAKLPPLK